MHIKMIKKWKFNQYYNFLNHTFKSTPKKQLLTDITGYIKCAVKQGIKTHTLRY